MWNSGNKWVTDLGVRFVFNPQDTAFSILGTRHNTTPSFEFGGVAQTESTSTTRRYLYKLLNTGDEDIVTFVTTRAAPLEVFAKAAGLRLQRVEIGDDRIVVGLWVKKVPLIVAGLGTLSALLAVVLSEILKVARRRRQTVDEDH